MCRWNLENCLELSVDSKSVMVWTMLLHIADRHQVSGSNVRGYFPGLRRPHPSQDDYVLASTSRPFEPSQRSWSIANPMVLIFNRVSTGSRQKACSPMIILYLPTDNWLNLKDLASSRCVICHVQPSTHCRYSGEAWDVCFLTPLNPCPYYLRASHQSRWTFPMFEETQTVQRKNVFNRQFGSNFWDFVVRWMVRL